MQKSENPKKFHLGPFRVSRLISSAHPRKSNRYASLLTDLHLSAYQAKFFSLEVGSRGFLSPSHFETLLSLSLSLTLQIAHNCSSFTLWSLSPCYSLLICHLSLPIWSVLAYTATSHHPFFQSVNLIFFCGKTHYGGGVAFIIIFPILFYFISFCRLLLSPVLFSFLLFWNLYAGLTLNGWLKMYAR